MPMSNKAGAAPCAVHGDHGAEVPIAQNGMGMKTENWPHAIARALRKCPISWQSRMVINRHGVSQAVGDAAHQSSAVEHTAALHPQSAEARGDEQQGGQTPPAAAAERSEPRATRPA